MERRIEEEQHDPVLLTKAQELFGAKVTCTHPDVTLVQHIDEEYGWFACYQCDHCGAITRHEVTADDLGKANDAPWLDVDMYEHKTKERLQGETLGRALAFLGKAAK